MKEQSLTLTSLQIESINRMKDMQAAVQLMRRFKNRRLH